MSKCLGQRDPYKYRYPILTAPGVSKLSTERRVLYAEEGFWTTDADRKLYHLLTAGKGQMMREKDIKALIR